MTETVEFTCLLDFSQTFKINYELKPFFSYVHVQPYNLVYNYLI